jgi:hypothetical protein
VRVGVDRLLVRDEYNEQQTNNGKADGYDVLNARNAKGDEKG